MWQGPIADQAVSAGVDVATEFRPKARLSRAGTKKKGDETNRPSSSQTPLRLLSVDQEHEAACRTNSRRVDCSQRGPNYALHAPRDRRETMPKDMTRRREKREVDNLPKKEESQRRSAHLLKDQSPPPKILRPKWMKAPKVRKKNPQFQRA